MKHLRFFTVSVLLACNFGCYEGGNKAAAGEQKITPGVAFLKDRQKWVEVGSGSLQGLDGSRKDSGKNICFCSRYDTTPMYEIIFLYKASVERRNELGNDTISNAFFHVRDSLYADFDCYAFVHPMKDPEKMEDMHDSHDIYPATVKVYKRIKDDEWLFIREARVHSLRELSDLKFRTMYGL